MKKYGRRPQEQKEEVNEYYRFPSTLTLDVQPAKPVELNNDTGYKFFMMTGRQKREYVASLISKSF